MSSNIQFESDEFQSTSTDLLNQVVAGDQEAWERFVEIYSSLIYLCCRRRGVAEADAADLGQNVLRRVFLSIGDLDRNGPDRGLRRWLMTIAKNVAIDHFRRVAKEQHGLEQDVVQGLIRDLEAPAEDTSDDASGSFRLDKVSVLMVRRILEAARPDYEERTWQAFWRTAVDDELAVDVAVDLGLSDGAVRQAKHKIVKRLRGELDGIRDLRGKDE